MSRSSAEVAYGPKRLMHGFKIGVFFVETQQLLLFTHPVHADATIWRRSLAGSAIAMSPSEKLLEFDLALIQEVVQKGCSAMDELSTNLKTKVIRTKDPFRRRWHVSPQPPVVRLGTLSGSHQLVLSYCSDAAAQVM